MRTKTRAMFVVSDSNFVVSELRPVRESRGMMRGTDGQVRAARIM
jgi:hypothetical protein